MRFPGKVLNFLWRACHNVLPTAGNLSRKQVDVNVLCATCHVYVEEATHTLFTCKFARELWSEVGLPGLLNVDAGMNVKDVLEREFSNNSHEKYSMTGIFF